jgi:acetyltransferase-like isoleucine patch superfamily enzyme
MVNLKVIVIFVAKLIKESKTSIRTLFRHVVLSQDNPTCVIDASSVITASILGNFVTVFSNNRIYNSQIDDYSYIQTGSRINNANIGKFCSIAASVSIAPGIHEIDKVSTHPALIQKSTPLPKVFAKNDSFITNKQVTIENDVWIGEKVVILDGVKIGNGAIIASGAIVTKDVEPYSVVGGVPAKQIKYRFDSETIAVFQKSEWWNFPTGWFEKNAELMLNPNNFIEYLKNDK